MLLIDYPGGKLCQCQSPLKVQLPFNSRGPEADFKCSQVTEMRMDPWLGKDNQK